VWPDLVYIELITMVILSTVLILWSLGLKAPAGTARQSRPHAQSVQSAMVFPGLQEMLVFFDPSVAGVVFPALIIIGLAAIPYLDFNQKGNGYYTIADRKFCYPVFLFGFVQLWILLILIARSCAGRTGISTACTRRVTVQDSRHWTTSSCRSTSGRNGSGANCPSAPRRHRAGRASGRLRGERSPASSRGRVLLLLPPLLSRTALRTFRLQMGGARATPS